MVAVWSTVPISVMEVERLMVVSCRARAGFPFVSCNCTKMQLYVLLSAGRLGGFTLISSFVGLYVMSEETCPMSSEEQMIMEIIIIAVSIFLLIFCFSFFVNCNSVLLVYSK